MLLPIDAARPPPVLRSAHGAPPDVLRSLIERVQGDNAIARRAQVRRPWDPLPVRRSQAWVEPALVHWALLNGAWLCPRERVGPYAKLRPPDALLCFLDISFRTPEYIVLAPIRIPPLDD
jgi:hypothetical protein